MAEDLIRLPNPYAAINKALKGNDAFSVIAEWDDGRRLEFSQYTEVSPEGWVLAEILQDDGTRSAPKHIRLNDARTLRIEW